jgi:hypothetical protein
MDAHNGVRRPHAAQGAQVQARHVAGADKRNA